MSTIDAHIYIDYIKQVNDDKQEFKDFLDFLISKDYDITTNNLKYPKMYVINEKVLISSIEEFNLFFSNIIFNDDIIFRNLKILELNFSNIIFNKDVIFKDIENISLLFSDNIEFKRISIIDNYVNKRTKKNIFFSPSCEAKYEFLEITKSNIENMSLCENMYGNFKFKECDFKFLSLSASKEKCGFNSSLVFESCNFDEKLLFNLIFNNNIKINNCTFKNDIYFDNSIFNNSANFENSNFSNLVSFRNVVFQESCNFIGCIFEKNANFYGATFQKPFNFSQAIFKDGVNLANSNINFTFYELKKKISEESKDKKMYEIANDYRDSFRSFKSGLLKDNNTLDASRYHKLELYAKEIELDFKTTNKETDKSTLSKNWLKITKEIIPKTRDCIKSVKEKLTNKDYIDKSILWAYRTTSDHHTDLLKIFNFFIINIGIFGVLSFVILGCFCVGWGLYTTNANDILSAYKLFSESLTKYWLNLFLIITVNICLAYTHVVLFILSMKHSGNKNIYKTFTAISYAVTIFILIFSPKYLIPAIGIFTDKRELLDPLATIGAIYTILFGLLAYSLIKTARKNSIAPS